jgi:hypothetical protein
MLARCKESVENKTMNTNELLKREENYLNNISILAKWVNSFDPNNVNDLF